MLSFVTHNQRRSFCRSSKNLQFATLCPVALSGKNPYKNENLIDGKWTSTKDYIPVIDPLNGETFMQVPSTAGKDWEAVKKDLLSCPKTGLHNQFKNTHRYRMLGEVFMKTSMAMRDPEVIEFFVKLIQRVMPKSYNQALGEFVVTRNMIENIASDGPRFFLRGFNVAGDHTGQMSNGFRWPYGPCLLISPFNFPQEIPVLQMLGGQIAGNKVLIKPTTKVGIVVEQFLRQLHQCGLPMNDYIYLNATDQEMENFIRGTPEIRLTQFTGSQRVAEKLSAITNGKVRLEDAGFDWKIQGPDVSNVDYVAWVCDQDAYACGGQKCSAQSILFMHENWSKTDLLEKMKAQAGRRSLKDLSITPVMTHNNASVKNHQDSVLKIPGSKILFGGKPLTNHTIPECFGSWEPTAVFVPLKEMIKEEYFDICSTELFGPFQIVTEFEDSELNIVLDILEKYDAHLTAGIASNDQLFLNKVLGNSVNGTTYAGLRARTTGAPQNHWFGPAGDPRGAGIGSAEAIVHTWTCHREVIYDYGPVPEDWTMPHPH